MNYSKSYWGKKENLELGVDEIMEKAQQKALNIMEILSRLTDIGRSNSILGKSAREKGDGPVFRENNHANSLFHKKV